MRMRAPPADVGSTPAACPRAGVSFRPVETPAIKGAAGISSRVACRPLLVFVHLSIGPVRQAVRHDCSFAKKRESRVALLVVVRGESACSPDRRARFPARSGSPSLELVSWARRGEMRRGMISRWSPDDVKSVGGVSHEPRGRRASGSATRAHSVRLPRHQSVHRMCAQSPGIGVRCSHEPVVGPRAGRSDRPRRRVDPSSRGRPRGFKRLRRRLGTP
jgi:hypothetical protein